MPSTKINNLSVALDFIRQIEQAHPNASPYEIANRLRGYTKPAYTNRFWSLATGYKQNFLDPTLDFSIELARESTDFAHLIAALSDQIDQPGVNLSDLTQWTADHTSWAGDIGSAIATYCREPEVFGTVQVALDRYANDADYAANIAAVVIAEMIHQDLQLKISTAIQNYHVDDFVNHVRAFITLRFGDTDPAPQIRRSVLAYLNLAADTGLWGRVSGWLKGRTVQQMRYTEAEINIGIAHFMDYLQRQGNLLV
jgi:hypothetical protein